MGLQEEPLCAGRTWLMMSRSDRDHDGYLPQGPWTLANKESEPTCADLPFRCGFEGDQASLSFCAPPRLRRRIMPT